MKKTVVLCESFSIVISDELKGDDKAAMNTRFSDETINEALISRIDSFVLTI